jgi:hypothetical protein
VKTSTSDKSGPKAGKKSESGDEGGAGKEKGRDKSDFGPEPKALKGEAVGRCLDAAVEAYGGFDPMRESDGLGEVLDHAIFAALGREVPARKKEEAVRRLHTEFVDWNEVRLAEAFELEQLFSDLVPVPDLFQRCERIKALINQVYQDQNKISLDHLREKSADERAKYLATLTPLSADQAFYVNLAVEGFDKVLFHYSSARVVQRLGIVKRTGSPSQMATQLEQLLGKRSSPLADQLALIWLGETICESKNPACRQCVLVRMCPSRRV